MSEQHFVDSKKRVIAKEINNENLRAKLKDVQTQLANIRMQCEDNVATSTNTKHERLQQQVENMQSQLPNAHAHCKDSMTTTMNATTMAAIWCLRGIGLIKLLSGEIVNNYGLWSYAICEKLKTDAPMYVTKQQHVAYALSRMKSLIFDKIAA